MIIQVDLEVDKFLPGAEAAKVSGYVGDYHVTLWLPATDPRVMALVDAQARGEL